MIKLRDLIQSDATKDVSMYVVPKDTKVFRNARWRKGCALQLLVQSKDELKQGQVLSRVILCVH